MEATLTTCAMDRRGRGKSGDSKDYSLEKEIEDVVAVVGSFAEPVHLLGHSFGAICSLEAALRAENVRKLVLYEPPINVRAIDLEVRAQLIDRLQSMLDGGDAAGVVAAFLHERVGATLPEGRPAAQTGGATAQTILRELRAIQAYRFDPERLAAMRVPTLLLLGTESLPHLKAATETLQTVLPESQIALLPGEGHVAMDTALKLFLKRVQEFLG
jgi:pimeloyl-ACP methyl ester carboxylesterase